MPWDLQQLRWGVRVDWTVFNDAQGGFPLNQTWNTFWDVKSTKDDKGWYVEMRVPFTSLRFNVVDGKTVMGITYWRNMARNGESQAPPGMSNQYGGWSVFKPSQSPEFEFEGLKNRKPFYVAPYVLGGITQSATLDNQDDRYYMQNETQYNAGLDVKFSPTSNLTMDLTFNTDFAQVEADDQQVNLTRFSLFFPEKRMFFQERSSTYSFTGGGFNRLFYSRRIGLEDGNTVPIVAGARLVGRIGKWDVGLLNMQTAKTNDINSANHSVVRFRKQVFNPSSYLGVMMTNKSDFQGYNGLSAGVDGSIRVKGMDYLLFGISSTHNSDESLTKLSDISKLYLQWENRTSKGLGYNMAYSRVGQAYAPAMGFEVRNDITNYNPQVWYAWIMDEDSKLLNHQFTYEASVFTRNSDGGEIESVNHSLGWQYSTKVNAEGNITVNRFFDDVLKEFNLSDNDVIPVGSYTFSNVDFLVSTPRGREFSIQGNGTIGQYYDGKILTLGTTIGWLPSAVFNGDFTYERSEITVPERFVYFVANIGRLKGEFTFNTKWSTSAFFQFSDASYFSLLNFRLRYNPREGNDLFLVYNEGMNLDRRRELPILPITDTRTLLIKYTHTFIW